MARINVKIKGLDKFVRDQTRIVRRISERTIKTAAKETEETIKRKIEESIKRSNSTGNLANSFFAEPIGGGAWGVGRISFLNEKASYWRHVNFGSEAIGASHSHRVPAGAFQPGNSRPVAGGSNQRWEVGTGNFSFVPTRPIQPLNYIAKTVAKIDKIVSNSIRRST